MWMGGWVPLGFERKDRTLIANEAEAKTVRTIFQLFIQLKNVRDVQQELARLNLRTKPYSVQRGRTAGNLPFARGHIYKILSNPLYLGEIKHKGVNHPGQHPGLISKQTWDAVHAQLAANWHANRSRSNAKSTSLLSGLIYDAAGNRLVSSHAAKNGKRYRYYVTSEGAGRTDSSSNPSKLRFSAAQVDDLVLSTLSKFLSDKQQVMTFLRKDRRWNEAVEAAGQLSHLLINDPSTRRQEIVANVVSRVTVTKAGIRIGINAPHLRALLLKKSELPGAADENEPHIVLEAEIRSPNKGQAVKLLAEPSDGGRVDPDRVVVKAVARARWWFEQLATGRAQSMAEIAARENITDNYVSNLIHLAWLPPGQVDLILEGDAAATKAVRKSMVTRSVDVIWSKPD